MRIPRLFVDAPLEEGKAVPLPATTANHVQRVLRLRPGASVVVFNGDGGEYTAELAPAEGGRGATVIPHARRECSVESPLQVTLVQGISRGERMDLAIQKSVELGVAKVAPVFTERTMVKLDERKTQKRIQHWEGVIHSACEQSGRTRIPTLLPPQHLAEWLRGADGAATLLLDPRAERRIGELEPPNGAVNLLIGPEGGLSEGERELAYRAGCRGLRLGPRVLRTETAAIAALAVLQAHWGDMG